MTVSNADTGGDPTWGDAQLDPGWELEREKEWPLYTVLGVSIGVSGGDEPPDDGWLLDEESTSSSMSSGSKAWYWR